MSEAEIWRDKARALHSAQNLPQAAEAMAKAAALAPEDRLIAFLHAQLSYEAGHDAAQLFARAHRLWPENLDALRNRALAEASEGRPQTAIDLLHTACLQNPLWIEGHRILSALHHISGNTTSYDASYTAATAAHPQSQALWLGWFTARAQHRDWPRARAILQQATTHLGPTKALIQARLFLATEGDDPHEAEALLAQTADWPDDFLHIARIRQSLRQADPAKALSQALPLTQTPLAPQIWPYLSTAWRLLDDPRREWLDGPLDGPYVRAITIDIAPQTLHELATLLRRLHQSQQPYAEQSVRGGTQTDRSILLRHEPALQSLRQSLLAATRAYIADLPAPDPTHPLLSRPRHAQHIAGSWSVRLAPGGHNVTHTHPMGWISSAFYVDVPPDMGADTAGHFHYGAPPTDLQTGLAPYATIAPKPGQLVLFPSTMWHGTIPTQIGERLNIAFDITPAPP
jgi:uncharacterized protein (TIGR02466 family)